MKKGARFGGRLFLWPNERMLAFFKLVHSTDSCSTNPRTTSPKPAYGARAQAATIFKTL